MNAAPRRWTDAELALEAARAVDLFRDERLQDSAYARHFAEAQQRFAKLLDALDQLQSGGIGEEGLLAVLGDEALTEALRYLAGPPISEDDLLVLSRVRSLARTTDATGRDRARSVRAVLDRLIDPFRFPWVAEQRAPRPEERGAALLASAALLAAQKLETARRNEGKDRQEAKAKDYLRSLGFVGVPARPITTIVGGPGPQQFCGECLLGERKADIVVRLHDTRLLAIECKVSNSGTNSIKRLKNDAAAKAGYWLDAFGARNVVPAALLAGVYKLNNLTQSQDRGLALFWSHDLGQLGTFIAATRS